MDHGRVFPHGAYVTGEVSPVLDFDASTKDRPVPARDRETGELVWAVPVMDGDPTLKAASKSVAVKIVSNTQPEIPAAPPQMAALGLTLVPVEFVGMAVTPWVNPAGRLAYSFKARGMRPAGPPARAKSHGGDA
ncbi:plasmid replication, integration and excision activator [Acrocarpospora sp. B8E8]|uniref:plasmid replication, integration and excision activator n=1 Tax=Acrocarpospora sp. B8E8 TaxID=3153572 RepID=UPI00325CC907